MTACYLWQLHGHLVRATVGTPRWMHLAYPLARAAVQTSPKIMRLAQQCPMLANAASDHAWPGIRYAVL